MGLSKLHRFDPRGALVGVAVDDDGPIVGTEEIAFHAEVGSHGPEDQIPETFGGLEGGIARHERDAARVAPQVDGSQVGVGGDHRQILGVEAEDLGDDGSQHGRGALAAVGGHRVHGDAAAAVDLEHDLGLRHVVEVDRESGARQVGADGDTNTAAVGKGAVLLAEPGRLDDPVPGIPPDRSW